MRGGGLINVLLINGIKNIDDDMACMDRRKRWES